MAGVNGVEAEAAEGRGAEPESQSEGYLRFRLRNPLGDPGQKCSP